MHEPSLRTSRLAISGGLVAAIAIAGAGFFLGRTTSPRPEPPPVAPIAPTPVTPPPPPQIEAPRTVGRADVIGFTDRAADALTTGAPLPDGVAANAGRRIELVLPFGCGGATPEGSTVSPRWSYDADKETLRIHVAPTAWEMSDWGVAAPAGAPRRLEGFWVSRPWSSSERCPQARGQAGAVNGQPVTLPGQTLAVAEMVTVERRRERRAYETVQRVPLDRFDASQGFRLRLIGRVDRLPGGQPVKCVQPAGIEQRPICLVLVTFDEIRIENPVGNETLATWSMRPPTRSAP